MPFVFNVYSALLLPFFVQGVVVSAVLLLRGRQHSTPADGWLALLLGLSTAHLAQWMLGFAGWYDSHDAYSTFMFYFPFSNWLAVGPALYFYFRSLTNQTYQPRRHDWLHFAPALAYGAWRLLLWTHDIGWEHLLQQQPLPGHFGTKGSWALGVDSTWLDQLIQLLGYISIAAYAVRTLRDYRAYRRYINDNFSDTERIRFVWLRNVIVAVLTGGLVTLLFDAADVLLQPLSYYQAWYEYLLTGALIYYLSIAGLLANHRLTAPLHFQPASEQPDQAAELPQAPATEASGVEEGPATPIAEGNRSPEQPAPLAPAVLDTAADAELARAVERLRTHMLTARPYLVPELTLSELAAQLRTNTSALSRVINTGCGRNFNDFVNEYRVQEAERKLLEPQFQHYTLLAVALESGFNSKSTFNRVFRKLRGRTPSEAARRDL